MIQRTVIGWVLALISVPFCTYVFGLLFPFWSVGGGLYEVLRISGLVLLWPAMVVARFGFPIALISMPAILVLYGLYFRRFEKKPRFHNSWLLRGYTLLLAYSLIGCTYVYLLPVPLPAAGAPMSLNLDLENRTVFSDAFATGYRAGMTNTSIGLDGIASPEFNEGLIRGFESGQGEYERLLSPLFKTSLVSGFRGEGEDP